MKYQKGLFLLVVVTVAALSFTIGDRKSQRNIADEFSRPPAKESPVSQSQTGEVPKFSKWYATDEITGKEKVYVCVDKDGIREKGFGFGSFCIRATDDKVTVFFDLKDERQAYSLSGGVAEVRYELEDGKVVVSTYETKPNSDGDKLFIANSSDAYEWADLFLKSRAVSVRVRLHSGTTVFKYTTGTPSKSGVEI